MQNILDGLVLEVDAAKEANETLRTWQRRRQQRVGPPFIKIGVHTYYRRVAIRDWILSQEVAPLTTARRRKAAAGMRPEAA
jgi:hypothetical protein